QLVSNQFTVKRDSKVTNQKVLAGAVESGSPAAQAGLLPRDQLVGAWPGNASRINTVDCAYPQLKNHGSAICKEGSRLPDSVFATPTSLTDFTKAHAGQTVALLIVRNGTRYATAPVTLLSSQEVAASQ